jgi:hypothetical protein
VRDEKRHPKQRAQVDVAAARRDAARWHKEAKAIRAEYEAYKQSYVIEASQTPARPELNISESSLENDACPEPAPGCMAPDDEPFEVSADDASVVAEAAAWMDAEDSKATAREVRRLKNQLSEANRTLNAALRGLDIAERRVNLALTISEPRPAPKPIRASHPTAAREATIGFLASDWHIEETVDPNTVNGRNEYNLDISKARSERFFDGAAWLARWAASSAPGDMGYVIKEGILWLGGDIITGYIHEELMENNSLSPAEAILRAQDYITTGIRYLLSKTQLNKLTIPCNVGNHGRTTQRKKISTSNSNSFEWLMYHNLAKLFTNEPRVNFVIADGSHVYLDVYGYRLRFTHGDDIQYGGGIGGISIPARKKIDRWNSANKADYTFMGHFHQCRNFGDFVTNGSNLGPTAYSQSIGAEDEPPQQAAFLIDKTRGLRPLPSIWVDDRQKQRAKARAGA